MSDTSPATNTELILLLGRIDGKLDTVVQTQGDHGTRIRDLERFKWRSVGFAAAVSFIVSTAIAFAAAWPFK